MSNVSMVLVFLNGCLKKKNYYLFMMKYLKLSAPLNFFIFSSDVSLENEQNFMLCEISIKIVKFNLKGTF